MVIYFELQLPNIEVLKDAHYQTPLKIYTQDKQLMAEFGEKRRQPVDFSEVPQLLTEAILATEDKDFYDHFGVDLQGLTRAVVSLITTGKKSQGGSTITMQVARNFFLSRKKTYTRKIKEILLAIKIDSQFSKHKILQLYLNKIYLGNRAYGVAAAAQVYYGKPLKQLTLPQMAMLAGLPKAPSAWNPIADPQAAQKRRNHVLERMYEQHYITKKTYQKALQAPVTAHYHHEEIAFKAPYVAEAVRNKMLQTYGEQIYTE
jgi:penicillin-binding protein 1A